MADDEAGAVGRFLVRVDVAEKNDDHSDFELEVVRGLARGAERIEQLCVCRDGEVRGRV